MRNIKMQLKDELSGATIERVIDISNFTVGMVGDDFPGINKQRRILEDWCEERGNEQHDTILSVIDWVIE